MYEIMPFDNFIKTCKLNGKQLRVVLGINDLFLSYNVTHDGVDFVINGERIDDAKIYTFACVDYLFDRDEEIYEEGTDIVYTGILMRDIMINELKKETANGNRWLD